MRHCSCLANWLCLAKELTEFNMKMLSLIKQKSKTVAKALILYKYIQYLFYLLHSHYFTACISFCR